MRLHITYPDIEYFEKQQDAIFAMVQSGLKVLSGDPDYFYGDMHNIKKTYALMSYLGYPNVFRYALEQVKIINACRLTDTLPKLSKKEKNLGERIKNFVRHGQQVYLCDGVVYKYMKTIHVDSDMDFKPVYKIDEVSTDIYDLVCSYAPLGMTQHCLEHVRLFRDDDE